MYDEGFKNNKNIEIVKTNYADECSFHLYELIVPDRERLLNELALDGINCGVHYRDNTEYAIFEEGHGSCPRAHEVSQHLITMPLHMWLTDNEVLHIIDAVNKYT